VKLTILRAGVLVASGWIAACGASNGGAAFVPAAPSTTIVLSGAALEAAPATHSLANVRIQVTDGPDAGMEATSDGAGTFRFSGLKSGSIGLTATKDGYLPWRVLNMSVDTYRQIEVVMYPIAPRNGDGVSATARCDDGTWSWETSAADLCAAHQGPAYAVCPGPLCVGGQK
jgi:hypothetical protein